jgi:hypothetical protein
MNHFDTSGLIPASAVPLVVSDDRLLAAAEGEGLTAIDVSS